MGYIKKTDSEKLDSDSTTASIWSYLANYLNNAIATGYSAVDECSEPNGDKKISIFKTKCHQHPKEKADYSNIFCQTRKCNFSTISRRDNEQKTDLIYPCACNPYEMVCDLKLLRLSITTGEQRPKLPSVPTCRLQSKCDRWVENKFTERYGSHFTDDLVFAVDIIMLMRNLNGLSFQYIIYPTTNSAPESPCNKTIDKALKLMWNIFSGDFEKRFVDEANGKDSYKNFQTLLMKKTMDLEKVPYEAKEFLIHCAMIGQWTVCAEKRGVKQAFYFAPLSICRTIHCLRIWSKITPTFWKDLTKAANDFLEQYS